MNDTGILRETETVYRRLVEPLMLGGSERNPMWWLAIIVPVAILGVFFVAAMYRRDCRSIKWFYALPLGLCRLTVYAILVYMFLLPAKQTWEVSEKRSRVLVVLDISGSMRQADNLLYPKETRTKKVIDFLTDDNVAFLQKLMDRNPVVVYRMGSRLDDYPQTFEKVATRDEVSEKEESKYLPLDRSAVAADGSQKREFGAGWNATKWGEFADMDLKPWILRNVSPEGRKAIEATSAFGVGSGTPEWAAGWLKAPDAEIYPETLAPEDRAAIKSSKENLPRRLDLLATIAEGTNIPESLLTAIGREAGNMVQGIVLFSDGRSTVSSEESLSNLRTRAKKEGVPIFTIVVGEDRPKISVRITDIQAPEQTTPNEPFKILVEVDGEGLSNGELPVTIDLFAPKRETPYSFSSVKIKDPMTGQKIDRELKVKILPNGDSPPHGQLEVVIDPEDMPEDLKEKGNPKELLNGEWKLNVRIPRAKDEQYPDKEHKGKVVEIRIKKSSLRVLLFSSGPSRDFQFLLTQLLRDKAEISLYLQNGAGKDNKIALLDDPKRVLDKFPTRLVANAIEKEDEAPYNLANYDVILGFDPDWNELEPESIDNLVKWVEFQGGGLIQIAGPLHTKYLARVDKESKLGKLVDLLPVVPGDIDLANIRRSTRDPFRLRFGKSVGPEDEYLRLDDEKAGAGITAGWEPFFSGKEVAPEGVKPIRGFFNYYPVQVVKNGAKVVATFTDPDARMAENKDEESPWLVTQKSRQGMVVFVGSGEIWRLRQFKEVYFERFWTKLIRFAGAGSLYKPGNTGRLLMSKEVINGSYLRVSAQMYDATYSPLPPNTAPKVTMIPISLDTYTTKEPEKENAKNRRTLELRSKKGPETWSGIFSGQILANRASFPPGIWKIEVEAAGATRPVRGEVVIKPSNPETDNIRPDYAAMAQIAGEIEELATRSKDSGALETLKSAARDIDSRRLAYRFDNRIALEAIPKVLEPQTRTQRNKGPVEDLWDKGVELPRSATNWYDPTKTFYIGGLLLLAILLLTIEWTGRKLLRLA